jgi:uncharacterized protein
MEGKAMKKLNIFSFLTAMALILFLATNSISAEYRALEDVESTDAVFDFRIGDPQTALAHLNLIHDMIDDPNMVINDKRPEIVIVFIGPSVKLVSTGQSDNDQQEHLDALADKISEMNEDGVEFEICMTSAPAFNVDPDSILPEVNKVENGWITIIGYQKQGYAMIANF